MITIGVDPDSERHGIAIYIDGKLCYLKSWTLTDAMDYIKDFILLHEIKFSIENVMANQFIYNRNNQKNLALQGKIGMSVGRCQQAQVELMRLLEYCDVPYVLHKPTKDNWAKDKAKFEKATGWTGRSNEDGRSAAYFGFLALK